MARLYDVLMDANAHAGPSCRFLRLLPLVLPAHFVRQVLSARLANVPNDEHPHHQRYQGNVLVDVALLGSQEDTQTAAECAGEQQSLAHARSKIAHSTRSRPGLDGASTQETCMLRDTIPSLSRNQS